MRFKITQRILAGNSELVWVVWDTQEAKIVSEGSFVSCSNACRELNNSIPETRLSQRRIDGTGEQRRGFFAVLSQMRNAVFGSTHC